MRRGVGLLPISATEAHERIEEIDAVRGYALTGVMITNLYEVVFYTTPLSIQQRLPTAAYDKLFAFFDDCLIRGKAQFVFGTLFGVGFAIFLKRCQRVDQSASIPYLRRLLSLFIIGCMNTFLFFFGDILHSYALVGFLAVITFLPEWALLGAGLALVCCAPVLSHYAWTAASAIGLNSVDVPTAAQAIWAAYSSYSPAGLAHASWVFLRAFEFSQSGIDKYLTYSGQFFLGFWFYESGMLSHLLRHPRHLGQVSRIMVPAGLLASALDVAGHSSIQRLVGTDFLRMFGVVATMCLAIGWAALVASAMAHRRGGFLRTALQAYGRLALTNYITQCFLIIILLSSAGLGLISRLGVTLVMPLGLAIAIAQAALSVAWLRRFRYGPLEWMWRCATYWSLLPLSTVDHRIRQRR